MQRILLSAALLLLGGRLQAQGVYPTGTGGGGISSTGDALLYNAALLSATTSQTSVEEVMKSVVIPANTLAAGSAYSGFEVFVTLEHAANTNAASYQLRIGGISGAAVATTTNDATSADQYQVHHWCQLRTTTTLNCQGTNSQKTGSSFIFGAVAVTFDPTLDLSLAVTGTTPTAVGDVYVTSMRVVLFKKS